MKISWTHGRVAVMLLVLVAPLASGCVSIPQRTKQDLAAPLDCKHLDLQMARLARDYSSPGERFIAGVQGIIPTSAIPSLIRAAIGKPSSMYLDHWRVALGYTNDEIDQRMDALYEKCGR